MSTVKNPTGNPVAKRLHERRLNVWEQAQALADRVAEEGRDFKAEEQQQWDRLNVELDGLDKRIKEVLEAEERLSDIDEGYRRLAGDKPGSQESGLAAEFRAFLRGDEGAPRVFDLPLVSPETRDLSKLTGAAGGDLEPTSMVNRLYEHLIENSAVLQTDPTVIRTESGNPIEVPKTLTHGTAVLTAELAALTEDDPTFDKITLQSYKYGALIEVSSELLADQQAGVDLEGYLARSFARAVGNDLGDDLVNGDGTDKPQGILTDSTEGHVAPTGLTTTFGTQSVVGEGADVLIELFHSVIPPYRRSTSCHWMMNDGTAAQARLLKNADGLYIWQPSLVVGNPDTILGKPVVIDPDMPDMAADATPVVFGDFSAYYVRFAGGLRFERSDDFRFDIDAVAFRVIIRADGHLIDLTGALKHLTMAAS